MLGWAKIRSWHRVVTFTRDGGLLTRCGRRLGPQTDVLLPAQFPTDEPTCESCLRLAANDPS